MGGWGTRFGGGGGGPFDTTTVVVAVAAWPALSVTTLHTSYVPLATLVVSHWAPITGPAAQAPAAPTCRTLEATPAPASEDVPATLTVPLTTPVADWPETATAAPGGNVSTTTVRPGLYAGFSRSAAWM